MEQLSKITFLGSVGCLAPSCKSDIFPSFDPIKTSLFERAEFIK